MAAAAAADSGWRACGPPQAPGFPVAAKAPPEGAAERQGCGLCSLASDTQCPARNWHAGSALAQVSDTSVSPLVLCRPPGATSAPVGLTVLEQMKPHVTYQQDLRCILVMAVLGAGLVAPLLVHTLVLPFRGSVGSWEAVPFLDNSCSDPCQRVSAPSYCQSLPHLQAPGCSAMNAELVLVSGTPSLATTRNSSVARRGAGAVGGGWHPVLS
ncbi:hypothetical protein lerEdw1_015959 [Lerista edwardsae]|nr:hypothetical protein lerEdw1_015959 [Lerista edwardsae]